MRVRFRVAAVGVFVLGAGVGWGAGPSGSASGKTCVRGVLEGEVRAGEGFVRPIGNGLEVMLEPLASGWILRVLPVRGARPAHDYAELATPPYRSVSPLLVSTDFSFRAQDTVGWNPREFRFVADGRSFTQLLGVYGDYRKSSSPSEDVKGRLAELVSRAPQGRLEILDAHLVPGMADQTRAAALVASHFGSTAHQIEQPADGKATPLGKVTWRRFRISLELPAGFRVDKGVRLERGGCM
jgi:hypothetical protein